MSSSEQSAILTTRWNNTLEHISNQLRENSSLTRGVEWDVRRKNKKIDRVYGYRGPDAVTERLLVQHQYSWTQLPGRFVEDCLLQSESNYADRLLRATECCLEPKQHPKKTILRRCYCVALTHLCKVGISVQAFAAALQGSNEQRDTPYPSPAQIGRLESAGTRYVQLQKDLSPGVLFVLGCGFSNELWVQDNVDGSDVDD